MTDPPQTPVSQTDELWRPTEFRKRGIEVSNLGHVRRPLKRGGYKIVNATINRNGYRMVNVAKGRIVSLHQLVARAFLGAEPSILIRHLDGDSLNNRVDNLAVGTSYENAMDTIEHGRHWNASKTRCRNGHEYSDQNTYRQPSTGWRICRTCMKATYQRAELRRRAKKETR